MSTEARPLCVDLDHTLIATDLAWESLFVLLGRNPLLGFLVPLWLSKGKAGFKREIAKRLDLDATCLPYREDVLEFVRREREQGRETILATGSDALFADKVAAHLDLFDEVVASDGERNQSGATKAATLKERCGEAGFDYVGDHTRDLPILEAAATAHLVDPSRSLRAAVERKGNLGQVFQQKRRPLRSVLKLMRPHHWAKNVLILVPLVLGHQLGDVDKLLHVFQAFVAFSLTASAIYVMNDLVDVPSDRRHPRKRRRPLASGAVPTLPAAFLCLFLLAAGFTLAFLISVPAAGLLAFYAVLTTTYSFYLKRKLFLDVLTLAGLYTHRIVMGGVVADVELSHWLLVFSVFFFLGIALAKRFSELQTRMEEAGDAGAQVNKSRSYRPQDIHLIGSLGPNSSYLSVLVLALWINGETVQKFYAEPKALYLLCPLLLYWLTRLWFLAHRDELPDDPLAFAVRDRISYLFGFACLAVMALASKGLGWA